MLLLLFIVFCHSNNLSITDPMMPQTLSNWGTNAGSILSFVNYNNYSCASSHKSATQCCPTSCMKLEPNNTISWYVVLSPPTINYCLWGNILTMAPFQCNEYLSVSYKCSSKTSSEPWINIFKYYGPDADVGRFYADLPECSYIGALSIQIQTMSTQYIAIDNIAFGDSGYCTTKGMKFNQPWLLPPTYINGTIAAYDTMDCVLSNYTNWEYSLNNLTVIQSNSTQKCESESCFGLQNGLLTKLFTLNHINSGLYCFGFYLIFDGIFDNLDTFTIDYICDGVQYSLINWNKTNFINGLSYKKLSNMCNLVNNINVSFYADFLNPNDTVYIDNIAIINVPNPDLCDTYIPSPRPTLRPTNKPTFKPTYYYRPPTYRIPTYPTITPTRRPTTWRNLNWLNTMDVGNVILIIIGIIFVSICLVCLWCRMLAYANSRSQSPNVNIAQQNNNTGTTSNMNGSQTPNMGNEGEEGVEEYQKIQAQTPNNAMYTQIENNMEQNNGETMQMVQIVSQTNDTNDIPNDDAPPPYVFDYAPSPPKYDN